VHLGADVQRTESCRLHGNADAMGRDGVRRDGVGRDGVGRDEVGIFTLH